MTTSGDTQSIPLRFLVKSVASATLFLYLAAGCAPPADPASEQVEFTGAIMGTTYHIKVAAAMTDPESTGTAKAIEDALKSVDQKMSTYKPDSEVSRLNASPAGVPVTLSDETFEVFEKGLQVNRESDGAFDITVGPLVNAWGFGPEGPAHSPGNDELATLLALVGPDKISLNSETRTVTKAADGVYCDPASVAEGYAVDQVAELLQARGYGDYMVEVGGEVRTAGKNASGAPWKIAIEKPVDEGRVIQRVVGISGVSLSTSGNYRKFYIVDGRRVSHAINPKTGRPAEHSLASASVIHPNCALADAYSTAIMVLGEKDGLAFAEKLKLPVLLLIHGEHGDIIEQQTPEFGAYLLEE
jgi:thiamine biosynthesis lipoprotein